MKLEQYTFIYQHHNGSKVYENSEGVKRIKFDGQTFRTHAEVQRYKEEHPDRLTKDESNNDPYHLTNDDWIMLKGE